MVNMRNMINIYLARQKELAIQRESESHFAGAVHHCCKVSANNHHLAFAVYRSVHGYPRIEQIKRPDIVCITEISDCVVVKDGYAYELQKEVR